MDTSPPQSADRRAARDRKKMEEEEVESPRRGRGPRKPSDHLAKPSSKPEQLHKQTKPPRPTKDPSPNYMKPTRNTKAREECSEVCTHKPCSDETKQIPKAKDLEISTHKPVSYETKQIPSPRDSGISTHKPCPDETKGKTPKAKDASTSGPSRGPPVASGQSKPAKSLRRKPSLMRQSRPLRTAVPGNTPCHKNGRTGGHTCSSTLKDAAFPQELEVTHAGSTLKKVCSYSCCSLNAHENLPTVKHPFLRRKVSIKAQRSFRVRGVSSSVPRKRGVRKVDNKSDTGQHTLLGAESASAVSASRKRGVGKVDQSGMGQHMPLRAKSASAASALDKEVSVEKRDSQATIQGASAFNNDENDGFLDGKDGAGSDQLTHPDTCSTSMSFEEHLDRDSEFSNLEVDIIRDFLEAIESDDELPRTESGVAMMARGRGRWLLDNSITNSLDEMRENYPEEESRVSVSEKMSNEWNEELAESPEISAEASSCKIDEGDYQFESSKDGIGILTIQENESKHKLQSDPNRTLAGGALISPSNMLLISDETVEVGTFKLDEPSAQAPAILQADDNDVTVMIEKRDQNSKEAAAQEAAKADNMRSDDILEGASSDKDNELSGTDCSLQNELRISERNSLHGDGNKIHNDETEHAGGQPGVPNAVPSLGTDRSFSTEDITESDVRAEDIISEAEKYLGMDLECPEEGERFPTDFECQAEDELPADIELLLEEYLPTGHEGIDGKETTPGVMGDSKPSSKTNSKLETRLSIKKNLIKKCFEKLRTIRQLTRASYLPTVEEENQRKIELRQMMMFDRKNGEEWMIDYKLRLLIDQLAKAQKKKVELLVEAYESILPKALKA